MTPAERNSRRRPVRNTDERGSRALARVAGPRGGARDPVRAKRTERRNAARRRAAVVVAVGVSLALIGALFAFYFPTRSWLSQRKQASASEHRLSKLDAANRDLAAKNKALRDPATIERLARGEYGMTRPGEKAYVVLPPPAGPTTLPQVWPFAG